jgi:hypothetical protein
MFRKAALLTVCSLFAVGCSYEVDDGELAGESIADAELAQVMDNALLDNAISANAISPNAISPNALTPTALPTSQINALRDSGSNGVLARMLLKYLVTCSLTPQQSFSFSWTDSENIPHDEVYVGSLGLAPSWAARGLNETEQRWVSACIGSRVNWFGVPVLISMRGSHSALAVNAAERTTWSFREGAFWGNLFTTTPTLYTCYDPDQIEHSRAKLRDCAAGHWDGSTTTGCGSVLRMGSCNTTCVAPADSTDGFPACGGLTEVVTSFLPL